MSEFDFDVKAAMRESARAARTVDPAAEAFTVWFVNNYPTDSVLSNPAWHAPRIFRAALQALAAARAASPETE